MGATPEHIAWIPFRHLVPGTSARTVNPPPERIADHARTIALCGILMPLLAERKPAAAAPTQSSGTQGEAMAGEGRYTYHLHAGHTRLAALQYVKADSQLTKLALRNGVDLEHVPVRLCNGKSHLLPIIENSLRDPMNDVDVAAHVQQLLEDEEHRQDVEHCLSPHKLRHYKAVLDLPPEVQQMIKTGRIKATTAVRMAKDIPKPNALVRALTRANHKADKAYKRPVASATPRADTAKLPTPMKVVNAVAAALHKEPERFADLLTLLHGMQHRMEAPVILQALLNGSAIAAPLVKRRGRPKKNPE